MEKSWLNQNFRHQSITQLMNLQSKQVVPFQFQKIPPCYTIVLIPDKKTLFEIEKLQNELREKDPHHYYYPTETFHLTINGNFPIELDRKKVLDAAQLIVTTPMHFHLFGVGSNSYCASVSAYPENFSLEQLRKEIRAKIGEKGDDYSVHLQAYEQVGWINYMRYLQSPSSDLLQYMKEQADREFGTLYPIEVRVYVNDGQILSESSELIWQHELSTHQ